MASQLQIIRFDEDCSLTDLHSYLKRHDTGTHTLLLSSTVTKAL